MRNVATLEGVIGMKLKYQFVALNLDRLTRIPDNRCEDGIAGLGLSSAALSQLVEPTSESQSNPIRSFIPFISPTFCKFSNFVLMDADGDTLRSEVTAVNVFVRIRPQLSSLPKSITVTNDFQVEISSQGERNNAVCPSSTHTKDKKHLFNFDWVAGEDIDQANFFICMFSLLKEQETVFEHIGRPITETTFQGYNGTLFAYGQTGYSSSSSKPILPICHS